MMSKRSSQSPHDRVLWELSNHGGSMTKSDLARRLQMRLNEHDVVLQLLEKTGKIKRTETKGKLVVGLRDSR
jgi:DNA-binding IclR family transcriptional regulator